MPLLDTLFGKPDSILDLTDVPSISDARIVGFDDNSVSFRLPDTSRSGRIQSATDERLFGQASVESKTNPTA